MRLSTSLYREWNSELPEAIRCQLFHHCVQIAFDELYVPSSQRKEPSYEQLFYWCQVNAKSIFSIQKTSYDTYNWYFYTSNDMDQFLSAWQQKTTNDTQ